MKEIDPHLEKLSSQVIHALGSHSDFPPEVDEAYKVLFARCKLMLDTDVEGLYSLVSAKTKLAELFSLFLDLMGSQSISQGRDHVSLDDPKPPANNSQTSHRAEEEAGGPTYY